MTNRHAVSFLEVKAIDAEQRIIEGWASRPQVDRVGDIVESRGAQFRLPLPLLLDHDHRSAVGDVFDAKVSDEGIRFKAKIAKITEPGAIKDLCDAAWTAAKAGLRKSVSIGFRPLEAEPLRNGGTRFIKWDWYELSMVAVPALASATIDQVRSLDRDLRAKRAPCRVVRLDKHIGTPRKALPVVRLSGSQEAPTVAARPVADAILRAVHESEEERKAAEDRLKLGADGITIAAVTAGAKATDAELAALRERLDRLERKP